MPTFFNKLRGCLRFLIVILGIGVLYSPALCLHAQELEPRAYTNTPVGMNFVCLSGINIPKVAYISIPPCQLPMPMRKSIWALFGYVRALDIAGKSAKTGILLRYADLYADGYLDGEFRTREDVGIADPAFYFTINLYGAPALSYKEFKDYQQDTIIGFTFKLTAPLGVYDNDKLLNIGTNRWAFKPEFGISQAVGRWTFEAAAAAILYTDNDDFDNGKTRQQDRHLFDARACDLFLS